MTVASCWACEQESAASIGMPNEEHTCGREKAAPASLPASDEATAAAFVQDALEGDKAAFTSTAELMAAARAWCAEKDEFRFGTKVLARRLRAAGCRQHSNGVHRGWKGVRLK